MTDFAPDPALSAEKKALRAEARRRRSEAALRLPDAPARVTAAALGGLLARLPAAAAVAGYVAMDPELDPAPLMAALAARGHGLALPVVARRDAPLIFRTYGPDTPLAAGALGIPTPTLASPEVVPHLLLVPLVAFDAAGRRLGQGGGYYDRLLATLPERVRRIGICHRMQIRETLPIEEHDASVDELLVRS